ncbi:uncharacterized protein LOC130810484 [Amaranthus tricolor]|uniref:uncharacterized protein LOC130810484 n=1 Tax=Amaranthus tricolor TaxID=29722 RepID=UPI00258FAFDE|nr:uncharacterized protein LOC130810484 [Amaranthus tricolor]
MYTHNIRLQRPFTPRFSSLIWRLPVPISGHGQGGRLTKAKAVPRKPSLSCSSHESSSSTERYWYQSSKSILVPADLASKAPLFPAFSQAAVGLSWVYVLKSTPTKFVLFSSSSSQLPGSANNAPVSAGSGKPLPSRKIEKISKADVVDEMKYWENSVVCYVTSANPPLYVVEGFVKRIWKEQVIDKKGMVNRGFFLVRFSSKDDQEKACYMNGILFDKKPFIVKPWFPKISI